MNLTTKRICLTLILACGLAATLAADRMTDRDLAALIDRMDNERDRFEDALPGDVKSTVIRGPSGEVDVDRFLTDFEQNINNLKSRLKDDYSASTEAATVLRQATSIDTFMRAVPGRRGGSEWDRLAGSLKSFAKEYGADFPLFENVAVRRLSRRELSQAANDAARAADDFKKALDEELKADTTMDRTAREGFVKEADDLKKDAEALRSRVNDDQLASSEAQRFFTRATKLDTFMTGRTLPKASAAWKAFATRVQTVATSYGAKWP